MSVQGSGWGGRLEELVSGGTVELDPVWGLHDSESRRLGEVGLVLWGGLGSRGFCAVCMMNKEFDFAERR